MSLGKITEGKLNYEIYWEFLTLLAKRMQKGKDQYKPYSWKAPTDVEELKQAYWRHTLEIMKGNYVDDNQEYGHLGAATANLMMIYYQLTNPTQEEIDTALKEFNLRELIKEYGNDSQLGEAVRRLVK